MLSNSANWIVFVCYALFITCLTLLVGLDGVDATVRGYPFPYLHITHGNNVYGFLGATVHWTHFFKTFLIVLVIIAILSGVQSCLRLSSRCLFASGIGMGLATALICWLIASECHSYSTQSGIDVVIGLATAVRHVIGIGSVWGGALIAQGMISYRIDKQNVTAIGNG